MKKSIVVFGMLLSIAGASYAQNKKSSNEDQTFELPRYITRYESWAELGKGNIMRLELTQRSELERFRNIDSLLLVFLSDIKMLQDSLSDPLSDKRIDYVIDTNGPKKIRIRQTRHAASTYLVQDGEPAVLKLEQDTVFILLPVPPGKTPERNAIRRYDRLGFFLNRYEELNSLITAGLNQKIVSMETQVNGSWTQKGGRSYLKADPTISSRMPGAQGELSFRYGGVGMQNYKSYFTPSFVLGMTFGVRRRGIINSVSVDWEPVFLFARDVQGTLQTYRNDFLVVGYSNRKITPRGVILQKGSADDAEGYNPPAFNFDMSFSLGYLINKQGDYFAKHTFRFCLGSINLAKDRIKIQPCMYFNDFFRGVTPGVRVIF